LHGPLKELERVKDRAGLKKGETLQKKKQNVGVRKEKGKGLGFQTKKGNSWHFPYLEV